MNKQDIMELVEQLKLEENLNVIAEGFKTQAWTHIAINAFFLIISFILIYILWRAYKKNTDFVHTFEDNLGIAIIYMCGMILFGACSIFGLISNISSLVLWSVSPLAALIKMIGGMV